MDCFAALAMTAEGAPDHLLPPRLPGLRLRNHLARRQVDDEARVLLVACRDIGLTGRQFAEHLLRLRKTLAAGSPEARNGQMGAALHRTTDDGAKPKITPKDADTASLPVYARMAAGYRK